MIIAVTMRIVENSTYTDFRDAISHDLINLLDRFSVTLALIPNVLKDPIAYVHKLGVQGLLLTGGDSLNFHLNERKPLVPFNERDRTELTLLDFAIKHRLPVFAVCRGFQLINQYFGGILMYDLNLLEKHVNVQHTVALNHAPWPSVKSLQHATTNSYHNQGVCLKGLASDLSEFAMTSQGVVEGLFHPKLPIIAVQWHPERDNPADSLDRILLDEWLASCK